MMATPEVAYHLDPADRIVAVNEAWQAFAEQNDGAALRAPGIIGQRLWDHLSDPTTLELYRHAVQRVRQRAATVRFEFRCDSPTRRRLLAMQIAPDRAGLVAFRTRLIREESREPVALLDVTLPHGGHPVTVCSWCKRMDVGEGRWSEIEIAMPILGVFDRGMPPLISHGMCPECHGVIAGTLDAALEDDLPA